MASAPTHIVATAAIAAFVHRPRVPWHLWFFGALLAVAPDLDVLASRYGVKYGDLLAHRGLSHSLLAAAVVSFLFVLLFYRDGTGPLSWKQVWVFLFLCMASHGVLDALTKGGLGVAFFAPFSDTRYFFPERPLAVSPLSIKQFLTSRGLAILINEMRWVWAPTIGVAATVLTYKAWRRRKRRYTSRRPAAKPRPAPPPIPTAPRRAPPPPPPLRYAPPPPPPPQPLPLLDLSPSEPPPPAPPAPPAPPEAVPAEPATATTAAARRIAAQIATRLRGVTAGILRHRRRLLIGGAVVLVIGVGVFVALQSVPPPAPIVEQAAAPVAPPPKPLQADAPGWYEPGYQFTVADRRFTRLTLKPDPFITFRRTGTKQEFGCGEATITPQTIRLRCEIERVGAMTIDGRFVNRVATTRLDAPAISAVLTVRNLRGEVVYSARDNFTWHQPDSLP